MAPANSTTASAPLDRKTLVRALAMHAALTQTFGPPPDHKFARLMLALIGAVVLFGVVTFALIAISK